MDFSQNLLKFRVRVRTYGSLTEPREVLGISRSLVKLTAVPDGVVHEYFTRARTRTPVFFTVLGTRYKTPVFPYFSGIYRVCTLLYKSRVRVWDVVPVPRV